MDLLCLMAVPLPCLLLVLLLLGLSEPKRKKKEYTITYSQIFKNPVITNIIL